MNKEKVSIAVDSDLLEKIQNKLKDGTFRSRSHIFEFAVKKLLAEQES